MVIDIQLLDFGSVIQPRIKISLYSYNGFSPILNPTYIFYKYSNHLWSGKPILVALLPDVNSDATGFVGFKFSDDFNEQIYVVNVHNIDNIAGVKLYLKNDTQGTTPVLDLLKKPRESNREDDRWSNTTKDGQVTGTIKGNDVLLPILNAAFRGLPK